MDCSSTINIMNKIFHKNNSSKIWLNFKFFQLIAYQLPTIGHLSFTTHLGRLLWQCHSCMFCLLGPLLCFQALQKDLFCISRHWAFGGKLKAPNNLKVIWKYSMAPTVYLCSRRATFGDLYLGKQGLQRFLHNVDDFNTNYKPLCRKAFQKQAVDLNYTNYIDNSFMCKSVLFILFYS